MTSGMLLPLSLSLSLSLLCGLLKEPYKGLWSIYNGLSWVRYVDYDLKAGVTGLGGRW